MASAMWSSYGSAPPKKRVATYGKSGRKPSYAFHDEEPSEHPKTITPSWGGTQKPLSKSGGQSNALGKVEQVRPHPKQPAASTVVRGAPASIQDPVQNRVLAKVSPRKEPAAVDPFDVPSSEDEGPPTVRRQPAKPHPFRRADSVPKESPILKRPHVQSDVKARPSRPEILKTTSLKNKASGSKLIVGNATKKAKIEQNVFDVPLSEDEDPRPARTPRRPRPILVPATKPTSPSHSANLHPSQGKTIESDSSAASRKRKAHTTTNEVPKNVGTKAPTAQLERNAPVMPQRSNKSRRTEASVSPRQGSMEPQVVSYQQKIPADGKDAMVKQPHRTRNQTNSTRPAIAKGQSAPAKLHQMLAMRESRPLQHPNLASSPGPSPSEDDLIAEDETMYDIPEPATPPRRKTAVSSTSTSGSVTPRQKQIWSNLLDDSSEADATTPGILTLGELQLSERRTPAKPTLLPRSASDIPRSVHARKPRLIDSLIQAAPVVEEDEDESEDESEDDHVVKVVERSTSRSSGKTRVPSLKRNTSTKLSEDMQIDSQSASQSQPSQSTTIGNGGPKITYAKQRSYLEETNIEDDLLFAMPMEIDSPINKRRGLGSQPQSIKHSTATEDDDLEDSNTKVRGIHELRKKGQNYRFELETQALLDDIADRSDNKSRRRSAIIELCTKMFEDSFMEQLFDSSLGEQFFKSLASTGEPIFDFSATVAIALILKAGRAVNVLDQIFRSKAFLTITNQLEHDADIKRIVKNRRTNLSRVSQEDVVKFRNLVQESAIWSEDKPGSISPRVVALRSLELLVIGLRKSGNTESLLSDEMITKLLSIASVPCEKVKTRTHSALDILVLNVVFSILEAASMHKDKQDSWSSKILQEVAEMTPSFFAIEGLFPTKLSIRLCINLTNNNAKACESFAGPTFVKPLVQSINHRFQLLSEPLEEEQRLDVLETAILSLGAMINLAEFSDKARASVSSGEDALLHALVKSFLDGHERAAQADSMEESHTNVAIGYLTVLLGNLCLNDLVRVKVRSRLPKRNLGAVINGVQEFIYYNEKVDQTRTSFEGDEEGRETWSNFTRRLRAVVDRLTQAEMLESI